MTSKAPGRRFQLIVGLHDLSDPADARGDELKSWVPFSQARPVLGQLLENARQSAVDLHLTSDDGFRSDYELLLPWLVEHGVAGTFFIPTRFVGQPGRMTVAQIQEIASLGIRLGVHGVNHINWATVPEQQFLDDMREGREQLQQMVGLPVTTVAPPFGGYDGRIVKHLLDDGFDEIHTCRPGLAVTKEALKPRNMLKPGNIETVLAVSRHPGGWRDLARCRLRRIRATLQQMAGKR